MLYRLFHRRLPGLLSGLLPGLLLGLLWTAASLTATGPAHAQKPLRACPDWLDSTGMRPGAPYACRCSAALSRHPVYGVFRYAPDSHICTAARHDGRIGLRGGAVTVYFGPGCAYFREAWRNGVQSRRAAARPASFAFAYPLPPCSPRPPARAKPKPRQDGGDNDE